MNDSREQRIRSIMSGEARDAGAMAMRALLRLAEPFYALAARFNNALFDSGIKKQLRLARPVISIGNITTGGTGKTPMVQWLARALLARGHHPAILLRGYTVGNSTTSDEATLLHRSLNIPVIANADRAAAGAKLLAEHPEIDVILLDDGFQHRRAHRDLNIVLIDATEPFGYGHVLPRGMLREPPRGLRRADLFIITRSNLISRDQLANVWAETASFSSSDPKIFNARNRIKSVVSAQESLPMESLKSRRIFSFCGIGNPQSFRKELLSTGAIDVGHRAFGDHHDYVRADLDQLFAQAKQQNAEMLITTEKDWVKIEPLIQSSDPIPIWRAQLEMEFDEPDVRQLLGYIDALTARPASSREQPANAAAGGPASR
jgi:tetraacyldisaccharide 4'-kinase